MNIDITKWPRNEQGTLVPLVLQSKDSGAIYVLHKDGTQYYVDPITGSWNKVKGKD